MEWGGGKKKKKKQGNRNDSEKRVREDKTTIKEDDEETARKRGIYEKKDEDADIVAEGEGYQKKMGRNFIHQATLFISLCLILHHYHFSYLLYINPSEDIYHFFPQQLSIRNLLTFSNHPSERIYLFLAPASMSTLFNLFQTLI